MSIKYRYSDLWSVTVFSWKEGNLIPIHLA